MKRPVHLTFLLAILLATAVLGRENDDNLPREKDRWLHAASPNFTVLSQARERRTRIIASNLEHLRATLAKLVAGAELSSPLPTTIYVFENEAAMRPYKLRYGGQPAQISGYFVADEVGNYVAIDGSPHLDTAGIVYHEYLHYFARNNLPGIPLWFNEGLAEYFSTFTVRGDDEAAVGLPIEAHMAWLQTHSLLPLDRLFAIDSEDPEYHEGDKRGVFYAQSWALVHYLLVGNPVRSQQASRFLAALAAGEPREQAFYQAFEADFATLEKELQAYVRATALTFLRVKLEPREEIPISVRELAYPETLYRLGDLLTHAVPERRAAAAAHFRAALAADPELGLAHAGLGYLHEQAGEHEAAREAYGRAVALEPAHFLPHYLYGRSLLLALEAAPARRQLMMAADQNRLDRARDALRTSTAHNSDFAEAWAQLGYSYTFEEEPGAAGIAAMQRAFALQPSRLELAYNLVLLHARSGNRAAAQALIDGALRQRTEPALLRNAQEAVLQIDVEEANRLLAEQQLEALIPVLERIVAQTSDPARRREVEARLRETREVIAHNRFTAAYNEAVSLINVRRYTEAITILEGILGTEASAEQGEAARILLREARQRQRP